MRVANISESRTPKHTTILLFCSWEYFTTLDVLIVKVSKSKLGANTKLNFYIQLTTLSGALKSKQTVDYVEKLLRMVL
jgi:hypothetical protein